MGFALSGASFAFAQKASSSSGMSLKSIFASDRDAIPSVVKDLLYLLTITSTLPVARQPGGNDATGTIALRVNDGNDSLITNHADTDGRNFAIGMPLSVTSKAKLSKMRLASSKLMRLASSKLTPCFATLAWFLVSSHSNSMMEGNTLQREYTRHETQSRNPNH